MYDRREIYLKNFAIELTKKRDKTKSPTTHLKQGNGDAF